jgi:hypothetical protein
MPVLPGSVVRRAIDDPVICRYIERLREREAMNRRTAAAHQDPQARRNAQIRADAYAMALLDLEIIARDS